MNGDHWYLYAMGQVTATIPGPASLQKQQLLAHPDHTLEV